jgi:hypothetical protein
MGYDEGRSTYAAKCRSETLNDPLRFEKGGAGQAAVRTDRLDSLARSCQSNDFVRYLARYRRRLPVHGADCARERRARHTGLIRQQLDLRLKGCETLRKLKVIHLAKLLPHTHVRDRTAIEEPVDMPVGLPGVSSRSQRSRLWPRSNLATSRCQIGSGHAFAASRPFVTGRPWWLSVGFTLDTAGGLQAPFRCLSHDRSSASGADPNWLAVMSKRRQRRRPNPKHARSSECRPSSAAHVGLMGQTARPVAPPRSELVAVAVAPMKAMVSVVER